MMLTTMVQIPASPKPMNPAGVKLTTKMTIPTQPSQVGSSDLFLTSHSEVAKIMVARPATRGRKKSESSAFSAWAALASMSLA